MVVERRDGILASLVKTKDPVRILLGERTWSQVIDPSKPVASWFESEPNSSFSFKVELKLKGEDTIEEQRLVVRGLNLFPLIPQTYERERINDPENKWAGKIRYTPVQEGVESK